jgi:CheY-like chemotaxis protein
MPRILIVDDVAALATTTSGLVEGRPWGYSVEKLDDGGL